MRLFILNRHPFGCMYERVAVQWFVKEVIGVAKTASLNIRLDEEIKKTAENVYSRYGLSLAEAVTVFIHQSCNVGGFPFDLRPRQLNAETLAAMADAERISRDPNVKGFRNMNALFEDLDADE
jgi:DNA-damage-inducible protein J